MRILLISFLFIPFSSWAQIHPTRDLLKAHQNELNYNLKFLVKDSSLYNQIHFADNKIELMAQDSTTITRYTNFSLQQQFPYVPKGFGKPLQGLRVAIDPGHTAYNMELARIEGKFVNLTNSNGENCQIFESNHNYKVGYVLKHLLENQGADVFMTRTDLKEDARGLNFEYWLNTSALYDLDSLISNELIDSSRYDYLKSCLLKPYYQKNKKALFKYAYNLIDIEYRAKEINAFNPHVTIIIHFNVDVNNTGWTSPTNDNYNMVFTPGAFMENELADEVDLQLFKNQLFSSNIRKSHRLGQSVLKHLNSSLNMSPLKEDENIKYLTLYSLKSPFDGVYSRNLSLTRKIQGAVCYGETIYQDHWDSCTQLSKEDIRFEGILINRTILNIAQGYFRGIKDYLAYEFE